MSIKQSIKKIPAAAAAAKVLYDWTREKRRAARIRNFQKLDRLPFLDSVPRHFSVGHEPTIKCNLRCKMCYQGQTRSQRKAELGTADILSFYEKLEKRVESIKLVGGEPFVRPDLYELISFWESRQKRIYLQTNCTLIDESSVQVLKKFGHLAGILTSLDGPRPVHDRIRGANDAFDRLTRAVGLIRQHLPRVPVSIFTVMLPDNINHLFEIIDITRGLGIGSINILFEQVYTPEEKGRSLSMLESGLSWPAGSFRLNTQIKEDLFPGSAGSKALKPLISKIRSYGNRRGCFVSLVPLNFYYNLEKYLGRESGRSFCLKLLAPELRIDPMGNVLWCDVIEKTFGSLREKTPDEIWLSEGFQNFRRFLHQSDLPVCHRCCKSVYI